MLFTSSSLLVPPVFAGQKNNRLRGEVGFSFSLGSGLSAQMLERCDPPPNPLNPPLESLAHCTGMCLTHSFTHQCDPSPSSYHAASHQLRSRDGSLLSFRHTSSSEPSSCSLFLLVLFSLSFSHFPLPSLPPLRQDIIER